MDRRYDRDIQGVRIRDESSRKLYSSSKDSVWLIKNPNLNRAVTIHLFQKLLRRPINIINFDQFLKSMTIFLHFYDGNRYHVKEKIRERNDYE